MPLSRNELRLMSVLRPHQDRITPRTINRTSGFTICTLHIAAAIEFPILQVRYPMTNDVHDNLVYEALHMLEEGVSVIMSPDGADDITVLNRLLSPKGVTQVFHELKKWC